MRLFLASAVLVATAGCVGVGPLTGRATEEWTKTYPLAPGGEVRIVNTNGKVQIDGVAGSTVEVRAIKTVRATTDEGARQMLSRITIKEDVRPELVSFETERLGGIMIGVGFDVEYRVKAPKGATFTVRSTNGVIALNGLGGKINASTTNGGVQAAEISGSMEARSTNGGVTADFASLGPGKISLGTTNGGVRLALPENAKADVSASWTNGGFNATGVKLDVSEENRRHIAGTINGGGTPIELRTTNGGIRVRSRAAEADGDDRKLRGERELVDLKHRE